MIVVKKFGGTSLGSLERIEAVADRIKEDIETKGESPIVVASAMSGETNRLISLAHQVAPNDRSPARPRRRCPPRFRPVPAGP